MTPKIIDLFTFLLWIFSGIDFKYFRFKCFYRRYFIIFSSSFLGCVSQKSAYKTTAPSPALVGSVSLARENEEVSIEPSTSVEPCVQRAEKVNRTELQQTLITKVWQGAGLSVEKLWQNGLFKNEEEFWALYEEKLKERTSQEKQWREQTDVLNAIKNRMLGRGARDIENERFAKLLFRAAANLKGFQVYMRKQYPMQRNVERTCNQQILVYTAEAFDHIIAQWHTDQAYDGATIWNRLEPIITQWDTTVLDPYLAMGKRDQADERSYAYSLLCESWRRAMRLWYIMLRVHCTSESISAHTQCKNACVLLLAYATMIHSTLN